MTALGEQSNSRNGLGMSSLFGRAKMISLRNTGRIADPAYPGMCAGLRDKALYGRGIFVRLEVDTQIGRDVHIRSSSVVGERFACRGKASW